MFKKESGILLHPTCLPGPFGIGELGPDARRFIDVLEAGKQRLWQVLPLTPPGTGASPYQSRSSFAGNPYLLSLEDLCTQGLLTAGELDTATLPGGKLESDQVEQRKSPLIKRAAERFLETMTTAQRADFSEFCEKQAYWLTDFTRYQVAKELHAGAGWNEWPTLLRSRDTATLRDFDREQAAAIRRVAAVQFLFETQWQQLRRNANSRGIRIIGDLPIFVALDSADVWSAQDLFLLDANGDPTVVAGVPPDYFSVDGQRWGNPLYDWPRHIAQNFSWWTDRVRRTLEMCDLLRIDHFRGFAEYWEILASEPTAINGRWVPAPGHAFFTHLRNTFGADLPIIAEDLGIITDDVDELRDAFELPTMRVLHFSFADSEKFLPTYYPTNCVAYTGTHDNDTTVGWFTRGPDVDTPEAKAAVELEQHRVREFFHTDGTDIHWTCIRGLVEGKADAVMYPLQDVMGMGTEGRMNTPGTVGTHNWTFRFEWSQLSHSMVETLRVITEHARRNQGA
jgi:4-alpha-glucanotransferase